VCLGTAWRGEVGDGDGDGDEDGERWKDESREGEGRGGVWDGYGNANGKG